MADDEDTTGATVQTVDLTKGGTPETELPPPSDGAAPRWAKAVTVVASVLVVALLAAGVWLVSEARSADARDERREQFVQAAHQTVLNLTTIGADTAVDDVQRIVDGATGDFKAEFEGRSEAFADVVHQVGVNSTGEVLAAGVQTEDDTCIASLVAARAMVQNADQPDPSPRDFRLRVTICDENGQLLASKVEFVP